MFKPVPTRIDYVELEHEVQAWWDENQVLQQYLRRNQHSHQRWSFIDGPITANNPMGVHHAWGRSYKDLYNRFWTLRGHKLRYQNGFDCQGLWIEVEVEKELGFTSKHDIEDYGVADFVEACKERVRRFSAIQTDQSKRLGYWMDWDNSYFTNSDENNYTIWGFLKKCWEKGWIYKGKDTMPWCPRCGTGISQHEIVTEGYQEITHKSVFLKFPLTGRAEGAEGFIPQGNESLLVWTTTPWTLAANIAAAVHPDLTYLKVKQGDDVLYVSQGAVANAIRGEHEVIGEVKGSELVGLTYSGPFDELPVQNGVRHRVIRWDEVSDAEGTGIVHIAPGAGAEDFALSKEYGLDVIAPLEEDGTYIVDGGFGFLEGRFAGDVADDVFASLRDKGILYRVQEYLHRYPTCWRCGSELVFRLVDEWFISMDELRFKIMDTTRQVRWIPDFGEAREIDWLRNMHDWMISKKRYYGLALPIFDCHACGNFEIIGSETELRERAVEGWDQFEGHSPHRPYIDAVKIACSSCGATVERISDVGNPWLDAGIVPFSTLEYRHNLDYWKQWFPADWVSESFPGQFRNWFYALLTMGTVMVLDTDHEGDPPFKTLFSLRRPARRARRGDAQVERQRHLVRGRRRAHGLRRHALAVHAREPGQQPQLRLGRRRRAETRFPLDAVEHVLVLRDVRQHRRLDAGRHSRSVPLPGLGRHGNRPALGQSDGQPGDPHRAGPLGAVRAQLPGAGGYHVAGELRLDDRLPPDGGVRRGPLELVRAPQPAPLLEARARRGRRHRDRSRQAGGLRDVVDLPRDAEPPHGAVHALPGRGRLPQPRLQLERRRAGQRAPRRLARGQRELDRRGALSASVRLVQRLVSLGRAARSKANLRVRQPLATVHVRVLNDREAHTIRELAEQVTEELNVKALEVIGDESGFFEYQVRPNLPVLGPKYGSDVGRIQRALAAADKASIARAVSSGQTVTLDGIELLPGELLVSLTGKPGFAVAEEAGYAVAVTTDVTPELADEGLARELVRRVQEMRKNAGFEIADRIRLSFDGDADVERVMESWGEYIRQETLSEAIAAGADGGYREDHEIDGRKLSLGVTRI